MKIKQIVIWGHILHDHTHSYIHSAFYKAFSHLGYKTFWLDNDSKLNMDFNQTLFLTHGIECNRIPLNTTSFYIFHNTHLKALENNTHQKIPHDYFKSNVKEGIPENNILIIQVFTKECLGRDYQFNQIPYYYYKDNCIYFPWATDLLPEEIDSNIEKLDTESNIESQECNFVGMPLKHWDIFKKCVESFGFKYNYYGGTFDISSPRNKSTLENQELIQKSKLAPALQSDWQKENYYIPCRIFKNISYGKMGMTNNTFVQEIFNHKLIYSDNIEELVVRGLEFEKRDDKNKIVRELMEEVRDKHTYLNRINYIFEYLELNYGIKLSQSKSKGGI